MRYLKQFSLFVFLLLFLAGCSSEPTFKVDSATSVQSEVERVKSELSPKKAKQFDLAVQAVLSEKVDNPFAKGLNLKLAQENFNGKTASEIIRLGKKVNKDDIKSLKEEIEELGKKQKTLKRIKVQSTSLQIEKSISGFPDTEISVTIKNETQYPIKWVTFDAEWKSPDRPVAWWAGEITCGPDGGLKVGNTREIECFFDGVGEPSENHKNAVLNVNPVSMKGPNDNPTIELDRSGSIEEKKVKLDSLQTLFK